MFELTLIQEPIKHGRYAWNVKLENEYYRTEVGFIERRFVPTKDETGKMKGRHIFCFYPSWTIRVKTGATIPIIFDSIEQAKQALTEYFCH